MAAPVWVLSVDLQTKTATFQTGLADAAKAARGAFSDIKSGAGEMGGAVGYSTMEARHSVMMLGEEFGVHLPRSLTTFIANLGLVGPALEAAFPFLAIILGATLLIEKLEKMREAGEKLTTDQMSFETAANNAFNSLNEKLLQAQIKADELNKDHFGALKHQLELIDQQSLAELQHSFLELAKAAEPVMKDLEGHWYTFGEGSDGAKHALDDFRAHYEILLSKGKGEEASGLLQGTYDQAKKTLEMMDQLTASRAGDGKAGNYKAYQEAATYLERMNVLSAATGNYTQKTYDAQLNLVAALGDQVNAEARIAEIKRLEQSNATTTAHHETEKDAEAAARKMYEQESRAAREYLQNFRREQQDIISATREGTTERLAALRAAMDNTAELYGEDSALFRQYAAEYIRTYNDLGDKTLEAIDHQLEEESRRKAEAGREEAQTQLRSGEMVLAAYRQRLMLEESTRRQTIDRQVSDDIRLADMEYNLKKAEFDKEIAALDKFNKDYLNKKKELEDKEKELDQQHEQQVTDIKQRAEEERNRRILQAEDRFRESIASGLTQSIMGHQTWGRMVLSIGDQVVSGMIKNAIMSAMTLDFDKEKSAANAARSAFTSTMKALPFPVNVITAPIMAAGAFTAVMAYESGTDRVPGIGRGDSVPALLSPGEGIVPGGVMDGLRTMARNGGFDQRPANVVHFRPTYNIQTIDGDGWGAALENHANQTQRHIEDTLRRMNK